MILKGGRLSDFLARPDAGVLAAVAYGPDAGAVRERGQGLVAAAARDPRDPFVVVEVAADRLKKDPPLLADEVAALSPTGERRVIRVREAGDEIAAALDLALQATSGGLVVIEAGDLAKRSALRKLAEAHPRAVALPCYADEGAGLESLIDSVLAGHGLKADADAKAYLVANLGGDRIMSRSELEKLALYARGQDRIRLDDVLACVGDSASLSLDELALAVGAGDLPALDTALERAWMEGQSPVTVVRAVSRHFLRLHLAAGHIARGVSAEQAVAGLKPPVFFKQKDAFVRQLQNWPGDRLAEALRLLDEAEIDCKSSGVPAAAACGRMLLRLAAMGRQAGLRRRRG